MAYKEREVKRLVCEYVFDEAGPIYIYLKRHICPQCGSRMSTSYKSEHIPMKEARHRKRPMPIDGIPICEDRYEIRHPIFWCSYCDHTMAISEMKKWERGQKVTHKAKRRFRKEQN